ncbi:hypothetical protein MRX96_018342 [Rhipicephalus microplus]
MHTSCMHRWAFPPQFAASSSSRWGPDAQTPLRVLQAATGAPNFRAAIASGMELYASNSSSDLRQHPSVPSRGCRRISDDPERETMLPHPEPA